MRFALGRQGLDAEHDQLIWSQPGMTSWYRNRHGRIILIPWRGIEYWEMTRSPDLDQFEVHARAAG